MPPLPYTVRGDKVGSYQGDDDDGGGNDGSSNRIGTTEQKERSMKKKTHFENLKKKKKTYSALQEYCGWRRHSLSFPANQASLPVATLLRKHILKRVCDVGCCDTVNDADSQPGFCPVALFWSTGAIPAATAPRPRVGSTPPVPASANVGWRQRPKDAAGGAHWGRRRLSRRR